LQLVLSLLDQRLDLGKLLEAIRRHGRPIWTTLSTSTACAVSGCVLTGFEDGSFRPSLPEEQGEKGHAEHHHRHNGRHGDV
jgi:hypothetical protein